MKSLLDSRHDKWAFKSRFPFASCMASIHHLIGWHAWLLPSSPWQCECPPGSHHHGNGSVPQQPSAWAECKPLNQDHHGNMCLLKHRTVVCVSVCRREEKKIIYELYHQKLVMEFFSLYCTFFLSHCLSPAQFFTSHCISVVGGCCDVAPILSGAWQEV